MVFPLERMAAEARAHPWSPASLLLAQLAPPCVLLCVMIMPLGLGYIYEKLKSSLLSVHLDAA